MVSKASDDFPEPESPVITTSFSRGMEMSMFLRLWTRAPKTSIVLSDSSIFLAIPNRSEAKLVLWLGVCKLFNKLF